jgi:hypothetical protein
MPVTVCFRRWLPTGHTATPDAQDGEIIALFPFIPATVTNGEYECTSYQHTGQHGAAEYFHVIENTTPVDPKSDECAALFRELSDRGYDMEVFTHDEVMQEVGFKAGQAEGKA